MTVTAGHALVSVVMPATTWPGASVRRIDSVWPRPTGNANYLVTRQRR